LIHLIPLPLVRSALVWEPRPGQCNLTVCLKATFTHDDPSTTEATKQPFPSLARRRVRWTAFSLAAAVLLCGSRVLADDGVRVHLDSPVPAELREISGRHYHPLVCLSPCDEVATGGRSRRYLITGSFPASSPFSLPDVTGGVTITVQPGSEGRRTAGFFVTLWGVIFFAPGVSLTAIGSADGESVLPKVGIPLLVGGGVTAIIGGVLLATSGTKIKIQQPGVGPVGNAAPVKARYWMGEF
jgi:hypothetical protein